MGAKATPVGPASAAVARRIRAVVEARGLTQRTLSQSTGISVGRINGLLNEAKPWYLEDVVRVCVALDLDMRDLLAGLPIPEEAWDPEELGAAAMRRDYPPDVDEEAGPA